MNDGEKRLKVGSFMKNIHAVDKKLRERIHTSKHQIDKYIREKSVKDQILNRASDSKMGRL